MSWGKARRAVNTVVPLTGAALMIFYDLCAGACSSLQGTFAGVDLRWIGIFFMVLFWLLPFLPATAGSIVEHVRTLMLSGALGGEVVLVRFQIVHDTYCPFCLLFAACLVVLFIANAPSLNRYLAVGGFLAGVAAFALFFEGSILPLYTLP